MKLFEFFASRHLMANLFTGMILLAGFVTLFSINRDLFPRVELDTVVIRTVFPGAAVDDVELNVTNKIEAELVGLSGVDKIHSTSAEDVSVIYVNLDGNLSRADVDATIQEIREAAGRAQNLPRDLPSPPVVSRLRASEIPILEVGFSAADAGQPSEPVLEYAELRRRVRIIEKKLRELPGVAKIDRYGFRKREVQIEVSPASLHEYGVPLTEIAARIQQRNIRGTAGTLESYTSERNLVTTAQFEEPLDVGGVIVRGNFAGFGVRVKDMAAVRDGFAEQVVVPRMDGRDMIVFSVVKKESADIIRTVAEIKAFLNDGADTPLFQGIEMAYSNDLSRYVEASFGVVAKNGLLGFVLVAIVLTVFLNFRTSLWVALGIPISLFGAIACLPLFGVYLDVISLTAMILVLGIVVDDAIIVSETIYHEWQRGLGPVAAAVSGISKVWLPVVTTVATTILAFVPMFFIPGEIGKFIKVIPIVIILALLFSLAESVLTLPAHIARALGKSEQSEKGRQALEPNEGRERDGWFEAWRDRFERWLLATLRFRGRLIGGFCAVLALTLGYARFAMPLEMFPSDGAEQFTVYVNTPVGASLKATGNVVAEIEARIDELPKTEIDSVFSLVGSHGDSLTQDHLAVLYVNLTPYSDRVRSAEAIVAALRPELQSIKDLEKVVLDVKDSGPSPEKAVALRVLGTDDAQRERLARDIAAYLQTIPGVQDVDNGFKPGKAQLQLRFDYDGLARMNLSVSEIARTVRIAYDGEAVTRMQSGEDEIEFRLSMPVTAKRDVRSLGELSVANNAGNLIQLKHVAELREAPRQNAYISHFNGERSLHVQASTDESVIAPEDVPAKVMARFKDAFARSEYGDTRIRIEGAAKRQQESLGHAGRAFLLAIIGIYALLVLLFNSFRQPFYVMVAVPFGLIGVIWIFAAHGMPLSFMALMGVISLSGVVVNDSLVLVDRINRLRADALHASRAIPLIELVARAAADRLRAIVMTTVTTVCGLLPMAYGVGGDDPGNAPMALALGWGLLLATPLILVLVPALYLSGEEFGSGRLMLALRGVLAKPVNLFWTLVRKQS